MNYLCLCRDDECVALLENLVANPDKALALLRALPGVASRQLVATLVC